MTTTAIDLEKIPDLLRIETTTMSELSGIANEMTHAVYTHESLYSEYCPVQAYVDCPPDKVYEYMKHVTSLHEWSFSVRDLKETETAGLYEGRDAIGENTKIFAKVEANDAARTIDYHCAWDQGEKLWMIYLNRVIDAQLVFNKPGSVIFWQNCRHPYYDKNPNADTAPEGRPWVGDFWDMFYAGHTVELENLKRILEYRHREGLDMGPHI